MATNSIHSCVHLLAMYPLQILSPGDGGCFSTLGIWVGYVTCIGQWDAINCEKSQGLISVCASGLALLRLLETRRSLGLSMQDECCHLNQPNPVSRAA